MVCLSCTDTGERVCLSAEGFGNRNCFLESIADRVNTNDNLFGLRYNIFYWWRVYLLQNYPPDLSQCVFLIDQALSVRALQELLTASPDAGVSFRIISNK